MDSSRSVRSFLKTQWSEWRGTLLFILFVLVPLKSSFADWNWVPTGSMNPTILEGDLVYVNKLAYDLRVPLTLQRLARWADPEQGDIVVLFSPEDGTRLVKRVIGCPGDTVELRDNRLYLNGARLPYAALPPAAIAQLQPELARQAAFATETLGDREHAVMALPALPNRQRDFAKVEVPAGKYFVMGDNRDNSHDSRSFGFADRKSIIGEATNVILSVNILESYQPRFQRFFTELE